MFYKETKYLASHKILSILKNECKTYLKDGDIVMYKPSYLWTNLQVIHSKTKWFSIDTLRDAALSMKKNNQVDILDNSKHIYNIEVGILEDGLTAFKDRTYIWKFLSSWKIGFLGLIALGSALLGIIKGLKELIK